MGTFHIASHLAAYNECTAMTLSERTAVPAVPTPHLNGRHVVFGEVVDGMDVVQLIERTQVDRMDRPLKPVKIADAGEL
jgi:cyclophilin family peptidyl-prolyl cis-trans isomerase